jgi:ankyrin repeat protein
VKSNKNASNSNDIGNKKAEAPLTPPNHPSKKNDEEPKKPSPSGESSSSSDHTDRDGIKWGSTSSRKEVRNVKDYHDSVIHKVTLQNDAVRLKELLSKGLRAFNKSIDGATPLHRAAEVGSTSCARILLDYNSDINSKNYSAQTPFHVAALNKQIDFGIFLMDNQCKQSCEVGCTKCRWLTKMISRRKLEIKKEKD